jgi:hypothetical protein
MTTVGAGGYSEIIGVEKVNSSEGIGEPEFFFSV